MESAFGAATTRRSTAENDCRATRRVCCPRTCLARGAHRRVACVPVVRGSARVCIGIGLAACLVGVVLDGIGKSFLPKHPVAAVWFLEGWVLTPAALAAVAGASVVLITVALTLPEDTPTSTTKTVAALSTGLTAFVMAVFISWAGDEKNSKIANHIKGAFRAKYDRPPGKPGAHPFAPASLGERWVYSEEVGGIEGWVTTHASRAPRE